MGSLASRAYIEMKLILKRRVRVVQVVLGIIIAVVSWMWFIEFGGWEFLLERSRRYPQLKRVSNVLDHPNTYYRWRSSMKVFDPLYSRYWYRPHNLKIYDLRIADADVREMNAYLSAGKLACHNRTEVPGELISEGVKHPIKASYHKYSFSHPSDIKKSWIVKFDSGEELHFIVPGDRGYFSESLSNYRAKKLGLLSQQDDWVWLKINNEDFGLYHVTGEWNSYWLEKSGKEISQLAGELDCLNSEGAYPEVWDGVWNWKYYSQGENEKFPNSYYLEKFLETVNFNSGENFSEAIGEIMDLDTLIRWKSVSILMNSFHTDNGHNWRMRLNPETLRFELLPADRRITLPARDLTNPPFIIDGSIDKLSSRIHSSAALSLAVDQALWGYVRDDTQIEDDLRFWDNLKSRLSPHLYADQKKHFGNISLRTIPLVRVGLISQYKNIREYLTREDLRAKIERSDDATSLVISSHQPTQVELESVLVNDQQLKINDKLLFSPQVTRLVDGQYIFDRTFAELRIPIDCKEGCQIQITAKNLVTGALQRVSL